MSFAAKLVRHRRGVADVGQNQIWGALWWDYRTSGLYLNSGGAGTMGFAFPASLGVKRARPDKAVWCVAGEGGFVMTMQELATAVHENLDVKIVILNKVDVTPKEKLLATAQALQEQLAPEDILFVSASTEDGVPELKRLLANRVPEGPWHFPEDQVSDATDRMLAAEVTREQLYLQLHAELPYACAVETEKYEERRDGSVAIHQQILIARDSQKAIVLGARGARLKEIGSRARAELAPLLGRKVHLFLHVKVKPDWEEDRSLYREIGLDWVE